MQLLPRGRHRAELPEELAVDVQSVSKVYNPILEVRYLPAVSLYAHLRDRRFVTARTAGHDVPMDDDADEEYEEYEEYEEQASAGQELTDVSFDVRRSEAVGVLASSEPAGRTVARILTGMTAPTTGRAIVRGRVALSVELATLLARRETSARAVAKRLAGLAGIGRRERRRFVRETLRLAFGEDLAQAEVARPPREVLRRVAASAAFDPSADILVVDEVRELGDPEFPARCLERLAECIARGTAAVIFDRELVLRPGICSRVVLLDEGRVSLVSSAEDVRERLSIPSVPAGPAAAPVEDLRASHSRPRSFDAFAALHPVTVLARDGSARPAVRPDDWILLRAPFEIAVAGVVRIVVRFLGAQTLKCAEERSVEAGSYAATLAVPPGTLAPGEYLVMVGLVHERGDERSKLGRRLPLEVSPEDEEAGGAPIEGGYISTSPWLRGAEPEWSIEAVDD